MHRYPSILIKTPQTMRHDDFVHDAARFLCISNEIGDDWKWNESIATAIPNLLGGYLSTTQSCRGKDGRILTSVYHVIYTPSFACPVIYFNMMKSGTRL